MTFIHFKTVWMPQVDLRGFEKKIKRGESIKRNAELFFVISKATITKTAIKPNSSIDFL